MARPDKHTNEWFHENGKPRGTEFPKQGTRGNHVPLEKNPRFTRAFRKDSQKSRFTRARTNEQRVVPRKREPSPPSQKDSRLRREPKGTKGNPENPVPTEKGLPQFSIHTGSPKRVPKFPRSHGHPGRSSGRCARDTNEGVSRRALFACASAERKDSVRI